MAEPDDLMERLWKDEALLAARGIYLDGVEPALKEGGPVEVNATTADPIGARAFILARYGERAELSGVLHSAPFFVEARKITAWTETAPGVIEVVLTLDQAVNLVDVRVDEDDTRVVLTAFVLCPNAMKMPGPKIIRHEIRLTAPISERTVIDAAITWADGSWPSG